MTKVEDFFLLSPPLLSPVPSDLSMRVSRSTRNEIFLDFGRRIGGMLQSARHNLILLCTRPRIICAPRKVSPVFYGNTKLHLNIIFRKCSVIFSNFPLLTLFLLHYSFSGAPFSIPQNEFFSRQKQVEEGNGIAKSIFSRVFVRKMGGFRISAPWARLIQFSLSQKKNLADR